MGNNNIEKVTKSPLQQFEEFYANKQFVEAKNILLQNKQQFDSGIFHYNLGTTYAKLGDLGASRFNLEKALHHGFNNSKSTNNLNYVLEKLQVEDLTTSDSIKDRTMSWLLSNPTDVYIAIGLSLTILILTIAIIRKIKWKTTLILSIIMFAIPVLLNNVFLSSLHYAIALKDIPTYEGPSKIFQQKGQLKAGVKIIIEENKDGWIFIKFPENLAGWVKKDHLGIF